MGRISLSHPHTHEGFLYYFPLSSVDSLELAKQLQEEERRAAEQEAAVSAERQQQRGPAQPAARGGDAATANRRQRERTHGEREEKKSDVSFLKIMKELYLKPLPNTTLSLKKKQKQI